MEFTYSTRNPEVPTAYSRLDAMHTRCEILLPGMEESAARKLTQRIWDMVLDAEKRYNRFDGDSVLSKLNCSAFRQKVEVDGEMFMILQLCDNFRKMTDGYFDISAPSRVEGRAWVMDPAAHTVRFSVPGMSLDLGGIIKGFVLEKAIHEVAGETPCALLSFGGSSTASLGEHPLGGPWQVSVGHPYFRDKVAQTFPLTSESLSVSGRDPHGRGHIIDPHTGNILDKDDIIAVCGPSALVGEVLSTALWVAPHSERSKILSTFRGYRAWAIVPRTDGGVSSRKL